MPTGAGVTGRRAMLRSVGGQLIRQSVARSSHRAYTSGFRSWATFRGLIGEAGYFDAAVSDTDKIQDLLEFVAWCASEGNQAGTIASKLSAVLHFHRINLQMELTTSSSLIKRALQGVTAIERCRRDPEKSASPDFVGFVVGRTRIGFILGSGRPRSLAVSSVGLFFCGKVGRNLRLVVRSGAPRALLDEGRRGAV